MRAALAIATVVLMLLVAAAPHAHDGRLGAHGCIACVTAGAEQASPQAAAVAAPAEFAAPLVSPAPVAPATGAPLGAIPGQSPPIA